MSIALTLGAELVVAKTVDYGVATITRHKDSPNQAFFAQMAREGLKAGWERTGEMLPWWYGALSSGASGATDFVAGSVIATLLRQQFDRAVEQLKESHPELAHAFVAPSFEQVTAALRGAPIPDLQDDAALALRTIVDGMVGGEGDAALLKKLIEGAPGVELQSPVARHLQKALGEAPQDSAMAGFVKRHLISARHAHEDPLGGTVLGHGIAGAATGLLTGHPELGVFVTLLDSLSEGLLAKKAMQGNYQALTAIKAQLLLQGIVESETPPDWKGRLSNRLLGWYSQMGEEVRLLGTDLGNLAKAGDVILDQGLVKVAGELGEQAALLALQQGAHALPPSSSTTGQGFASDQPAVGPLPDVVTTAATMVGRQQGTLVAGSLASLVREQVKGARHELDHHANVKMGEVLAADFTAEREALVAAFERLQARTGQRLDELKVTYPHLTNALAAARRETSKPTLSRWLASARELVGKAATTTVQAFKGGRDAVVDSAKDAMTRARDSALGKAILTLADDVMLSFAVPAQLAIEDLQRASLKAAFAVIDVGGNALTKGLLAGERFVQKNDVEVAALLQACSQIVDRMGAATMAMLVELKRSGSLGAQELGSVLSAVLRSLDAAVGRRMTPG